MRRMGLLVGVIVVAFLVRGHAQSKNLDIYWIDVEGGAATLLIAPSGESLLYDAGYGPPNATNDRDAKRIVAAAQAAGLKKIDYFVLSHYHADHVGRLPALAKMIPIGRYFDHGDTVEDVDRPRLDLYKQVAGSARTTVKPGDSIPLKGIKAEVVSSDGQFIAKAINGGGPNALCAPAERKAPAPPENGRNVGMLFTFGKFTFLDLADLDWASEMALTCPVNKVGTVTIWQTDRHGNLFGAGAPAMLGAIKPQVIVVNNGPRKGLGQVDTAVQSLTRPGYQETAASYAYEKIARLPGVEGIWQGHIALADPDHNTSRDQIANFEETADCKGNWIRASIAPDGKFTITNGRNGFSKRYVARSPQSGS
jgi:L-ascorbate metabolism protein UlaG (beta-lactamase superfamily)